MAHLHQVLSGQRCIMCTSPIGRENPVAMPVYDMGVCGRGECLSAVLDVPVGEFIDDNEEVSYG